MCAGLCYAPDCCVCVCVKPQTTCVHVQVAGWQDLDPATALLRRIAAAEGAVAGLAPTELQHSGGLLERDANATQGRGTPLIVSGKITLDAEGDSYFEYLLKAYLMGGKMDVTLRDAYVAAMSGVREWLLKESAPEAVGGLLYVHELQAAELKRSLHSEGPAGDDYSPSSMGHLSCFLPGTLALGHLHGVETGVLRCSLCNAGTWRKDNLPACCQYAAKLYIVNCFSHTAV
jgi:Glycosyl hydrolase family 47